MISDIVKFIIGCKSLKRENQKEELKNLSNVSPWKDESWGDKGKINLLQMSSKMKLHPSLIYIGILN